MGDLKSLGHNLTYYGNYLQKVSCRFLDGFEGKVKN